MNCKQIHPLLTRYLLQDLDAEQCATVDEHVATCESCRNELKALEPTLTLLSEALSEPVGVTYLTANRRKRILHPGRTRQTIQWIGSHHPRLAVAAGFVIVLGMLWVLVMPATMKSKSKAYRVSVVAYDPEPLEDLMLEHASEYGEYPELEEESAERGVRVKWDVTTRPQSGSGPAPTADPSAALMPDSAPTDDGQLTTKRGFDIPASRQSLLRRTLSRLREGNDKGRAVSPPPEPEPPLPPRTAEVDYVADVEMPPREALVLEPTPELKPKKKISATRYNIPAEPAEFDSAAIVKSPVAMKGIHASRAPGVRGTTTTHYGGRAAGLQVAGEVDGFSDDSDIVVHLSDGRKRPTEGAGPLSGESWEREARRDKAAVGDKLAKALLAGPNVPPDDSGGDFLALGGARLQELSMPRRSESDDFLALESSAESFVALGGQAGSAGGSEDTDALSDSFGVRFSDMDEARGRKQDRGGEAAAPEARGKAKSGLGNTVTAGTELQTLGDKPLLGRLFKAKPAKPRPAPAAAAPAAPATTRGEAAERSAGQMRYYSDADVDTLSATIKPTSKEEREADSYWYAKQPEAEGKTSRKTSERLYFGSGRDASLRRFDKTRPSEADSKQDMVADAPEPLDPFGDADGEVDFEMAPGQELSEQEGLDPFAAGKKLRAVDQVTLAFSGKDMIINEALEAPADLSATTYDVTTVNGTLSMELGAAAEGDVDGNGLVALSSIAGPVPPEIIEGTPMPIRLPPAVEVPSGGNYLVLSGGAAKLAEEGKLKDKRELGRDGAEEAEKALKRAQDDLAEHKRLHDVARVEARGTMEGRYVEALAERRSQLTSELSLLEAKHRKLKDTSTKEVGDISGLALATGEILSQEQWEWEEEETVAMDSLDHGTVPSEEAKRRKLEERYRALKTQLAAIETAEYKWSAKNALEKQRQAEAERLAREEEQAQAALRERREAIAKEEARKAEEKAEPGRFKAFGVNPFVEVAHNAFSTFAIDVDTAAYTVGRNYMQRGQLPPAESVRTEEFVNFFDYAYKAPVRDTFKVYTEVAPSKFGRGLHLVKIGVKGRRLGREEQRRASLTFLIDTSGSMNQSDRLGLVQTSLDMLVNELNPDDRVAIVQYDSHARLLLEHTPVSQKETILKAVKQLQCGGSTNLEEGMHRAYGLAAANFIPKGENRVLLLSDGVANLGSGAAEDILGKVDEYRRQGITCSVFGFGMGTYDDAMLETLANKGDGTYAFIDSEAEARRVFVDELSATLNTIATDVKIQVEFDSDQVVRYRQLGYENRQLKKEDFRNDAVDAGEVGSGQSVTALYEVELAKPVHPTPYVQARHPEANTLATVRVRYRRVDTGAVEEIDQRVRRRDVLSRFESTPPRFQLAAAVGEFAEILRGSPYAQGSKPQDVAAVLRPVALELSLDAHVQELLRMVEGADAMSRGR